MDPNTPPTHYGIAVYDQAPPPAEPNYVSLCIEARTTEAVLTRRLRRVTCRKCNQLLVQLGPRPDRRQ